MSEILPSQEELLNRAYQQGRNDAIEEIFNALPDCDKIDIEHLVTIIEQIKEKKNGL